MFIIFKAKDGRTIVRKKSQVREVSDTTENQRECTVKFEGKLNFPVVVAGGVDSFYRHHLLKD